MKTENIKSECRKDKPFFKMLITLSLRWGFESLQYQKKREKKDFQIQHQSFLVLRL